MTNTLVIVSDGYLSGDYKTISIASSGYLDIYDEMIDIIDSIRRGGGEITGMRKKDIDRTRTLLLDKIAKHSKKLKIEDEEILNILNIFLQWCN